MNDVYSGPGRHRHSLFFQVVVGLLICLLGSAALAQPVAPAPGSGPAPDLTFELALWDTPLDAALKVIADQAGKALEIHARMNESVDITLSGATLEVALSKLLEGKPFTWSIEGDVIHVYPNADETAAPPAPSRAPAPQKVTPREKSVVTRIFPLKRRKVESIFKLLTGLATKDVSLIPDVPSNSLVMVGSEKQIEIITRLAVEIDEMPVTTEKAPPEEIVTEAFSLEFITEFDDLQANLSSILYGDSARRASEGDPRDTLLATPTSLGGPTTQRREFFMLDKQRRILMITATASKMEMIREYFRRINTPVAQVLIEAHIVALEEGTDRNLGITWNVQDQWGAVYANPGGRQNFNTTTQNFIGGSFQFGRWDLADVTGILRAVQNEDRGQILSQPKLMTLSGKTAVIDISTKYPYKSSVTQNQVGTTQNTQFVDVGITLNVTPQVNQQADTIVMQLDPNVSDLVSLSPEGPITTQRRTSTNVEVRNGETVVIGGLLRDENIGDSRTVPFLSKIPVVGEFFRFSQKRKKRTNLMILITPRIVGTDPRIAGSVPAPERGAGPLTRPPSTHPEIARADPPQPSAAPDELYQQRLSELKGRYLEAD